MYIKIETNNENPTTPSSVTASVFVNGASLMDQTSNTVQGAVDGALQQVATATKLLRAIPSFWLSEMGGRLVAEGVPFLDITFPGWDK